MRTPRSLPFAVAALLLVSCATSDGDGGLGVGAQTSSAAEAAESGDASPVVAEPTEHVPRGVAVPARAAYPRIEVALRALIADPDLAVDGPLALAVTDERGYVLLADAEEQPMLPASTMKVVTAAGALVVLGADHRYVTPAVGTAPIVDGVLDGHLVLVGQGDPALTDPRFTEHAYPERPRTPMEDLVADLVAGGLRTVTGDVVGDASIFADEPLAGGTLERHLGSLDMSRASGLTVDYGMDVTYHEDGRAIGTMAEDPAERAAAVLAEMLEAEGVRIDGVARSGTVEREGTVELAAVESPPLSTMLRFAVQRSDNHLSDGIFRTLGAVTGDPTWEGSAAAVTGALSMDWSGAVLADGSGLSREDRLTAEQLTTLDRIMTTSDHGTEWRGLMAVAGESGTLRRRLRGTLADRLLIGKTGTLDDVRALIASVEGRDRRRFHLAVIGNDLAGDDRDRVRLLTDEIALRLTEDLLGCVRVSTQDHAADEGSAPREVVRCP